ncbi:carboxymuconolactone decarboxylase family protein [Desulfogranum mediterraneum]|uniref:carboxymuconolactone decarboxylase family protein n=1 Tax=Desulfogranum mediterraneum TaxID=160661 RepID=UPI0003F73F2A|nr:carboxymuconolactone decarboxylase family protein [Desulfogranum mediterraneum]
MSQQPQSHYQYLQHSFPEVMTALENLGSTVRQAGPLDRKTTELIQLGVAAATQSTGAVHSHARRAREAGASREELQHALLVLISTIGFPKVAAALAWIQDSDADRA